MPDNSSSHAAAPRDVMALVFVAGLYGAAGVATAAAAAHRVNDPLLSIASNFLLLHAAALLGATAAAKALGAGRLMLTPAWVLALGTLLFCGDLLAKVATGASPVPLAAPIGGSLLIIGWLGLAVGGAWSGVRAAGPGG